MDTLCSQAYGARQYKKMGIFFQTGLIVLFASIVPIVGVNWYCEDILKYLNQPPIVAEMAGRFIRLVLPSLPFLFTYELVKKILQAQNIVTPMVYIALIGDIVIVVLGYILCYHTSWGFQGAAIARTIGTAVYPVLLIPYFWKTQLHHQFWAGWDLRQALQNVAQFLQFGVAGMLMFGFEWWAFEALALLSGLLPNGILAISINSVLMNVSTLVYMFYFGVSVAGNVRVGNALGANQPEHARCSANICMVMGFACSLMTATMLILFRAQIPALIVNDALTVQKSAGMMYILAGFQVVDSVNGSNLGVFRGMGFQVLGAKFNFVAYYLIGLPFAAVLAFPARLGVAGLWIGMAAGLAMSCIATTIVIQKANWPSLAMNATVGQNLKVTKA